MCKACFRLVGLTFAARELNPLDRDERFQLMLTIIPLSCSPDAHPRDKNNIKGSRKGTNVALSVNDSGPPTRDPCAP